MPDRKWRMTRLGSGDWLLPSNDRQTLWRLMLVPERDGSLTRGDGSVVNGDYWSVFRCRWSLPQIEAGDSEVDLTWDEAWDEHACMMSSRQEAIDWCLSREEIPSR